MSSGNINDLFKIIEIEINSYCNLSCSYCPNREFERKEKGTMPFSDYKKIIAQLKALDFQGRLSHEFYGEPTLHPQFNEIVSYTKRELPKVKIELYSNATQLDLKRIRELLYLGIDEFIITKHIGQELRLFEEAYAQLTEEERHHITYRTHQEIYKTNRGGILDDIGDREQPLLPCYIPSFLMTITLKGNVLACFEDFFQHHEMGNVFQEDLKEIWLGEKFSRFREDLRKGLRHKYSACKHCNRIQSKEPEEVNLLNREKAKA